MTTRKALLFCVLASCSNRVSSTEQCLGNGSITSTFEDYTFDVDSGPALDVAGNCHVVLINCTIRAPEGIRAGEDAVVTVRGGSLTARGAAVRASGRAVITFDGTKVVGDVKAVDAARVVYGDAARAR
jgi:hypothetical protein